MKNEVKIFFRFSIIHENSLKKNQKQKNKPHTFFLHHSFLLFQKKVYKTQKNFEVLSKKIDNNYNNNDN